MTVCIAAMPSYTYAVKGAKLLRARGYSCEIKRTEKNRGGCGYSLHIYSECKNAAAVLNKYAVPYKINSDGGAV